MSTLIYTKLSAATTRGPDDWQAAFMEALRGTTPRDRRPGFGFMDPPDPVRSRLRLAMVVSPTTRQHLYMWRTFAFGPIMQHPDVPDDEVWCVHMDKDEIDAAFRDPANQPVGERWRRAWIIAGEPGAYGMDEVATIMGHLHHAELKTAS